MKETAATQLAASRTAKGLSKESAARLLGISTRHYYNLEAGRVHRVNDLLRRRLEREFGVEFPTFSSSDRSAA